MPDAALPPLRLGLLAGLAIINVLTPVTVGLALRVHEGAAVLAAIVAVPVLQILFRRFGPGVLASALLHLVLAVLLVFHGATLTRLGGPLTRFPPAAGAGGVSEEGPLLLAPEVIPLLAATAVACDPGLRRFCYAAVPLSRGDGVVAIVLTYTRSPCPDSAPRRSDCLIEPARLRGGTTWRVALPSERWAHAGAVAALPAALRSLPQLVSIDDPGARYASARTQVAAAFIAANALFLAWVLFARIRARTAQARRTPGSA